MTISQLQPEAVDNMRAFFPDRRELNYALGNIHSTYWMAPRLFSFIPGNIDSNADGTVFTDLVQFTAYTGTNLSFGVDTILAYNIFNGVSSEIFGSEAALVSSQVSVYGWFRFESGSLGSAKGLISKWRTSGGDFRCYTLRKDAANKILFEISELGTAATVKTVTSTNAVIADTWYFVCGTFEGGVALKVYVSNPTVNRLVVDTNTTTIPATVFDTSIIARIGSRDGGEFLEGDGILYSKVAITLSSAVVSNLYQTALPLFV